MLDFLKINPSARRGISGFHTVFWVRRGGQFWLRTIGYCFRGQKAIILENNRLFFGGISRGDSKIWRGNPKFRLGGDPPSQWRNLDFKRRHYTLPFRGTSGKSMINYTKNNKNVCINKNVMITIMQIINYILANILFCHTQVLNF